MNTTPHIISDTATLRQALARLNELSGKAMTLFVVDASGRLAGTLTDGDVRRALLGDAALDDSVCLAMNRNFRKVGTQPDPAMLRSYRQSGISLVPVVDDSGHPIDAIDLCHHRTRLPLRALLMAGGKGERLRPATLNCPKPLLKIEGKAIIDYNVEALAACGITDITVATGYLAEQLEEHFATPVAGVDVATVRERTPLGTIGAATLLEADSRHTLVMNSDLLTTLSFEDMYIAHTAAGNAATVAVIPYQVSVPFAVLTTDAWKPHRVNAIEEKPSFSYWANAGIYIFSPETLALLQPGERTDATDLLQRAIDLGMPVGYHVVEGTWIDVGSPGDFRQASDLMRHFNNMNKSF